MFFRNHLFKILLAFIFGILLAKILNVDWVISFTIWSWSMVLLLTFIYFGRKNYKSRRAIGFSLIFAFCCSGFMSYSASQNSNIRNHYYKYFLPKDQLLGKVIDFQKGDGDYNKFVLSVDHVFNDFNSRQVEGMLLCYASKEIDEIEQGNKIIIAPEIHPIVNNNNPGAFDAESFWATQGITEMTFLKENSVVLVEASTLYETFWRDAREYFKSVLNDFVSKENYGVATALVLGDKSSLTKENRSIFANAGAMHVLAVSGMHVGILLGFLQWIFYRVPFLRRRNLYIYSSLIIVWCFAFLTGMSASVFRATLMFSVLAIGQLRGYSFFSMNALLFSGLLLLIIDPFYLFNIGFQLSFLAMLGIVFFYGKIRDLITIQNKWLNYFWEGTAIGIAAQIGTVPISLYYFNQFPNYFILTNLGLLILAAVALISTILLFIFHLVPFINYFIGEIVDFVFGVLNSFVGWINDLPYAISTGFNPSILHVTLIYFSIIILLHYHSKRRLLRFRLASITLFLLAMGLVVEREMNKEMDELVVFNHYNKTIVLKEGENMFCFYEDNKKNQLDKTKFLVSGYSKQMGCQISYYPVKNDRVVYSDVLFELTPKSKGWNFDYYTNSYVMLDKNNAYYKSDRKTISGAWNKYVSNKDYSTIEKALILKP